MAGPYANKKKTGSTDTKSYNPKTSVVGGGGSPAIVGMYSPAGSDTPSAPSSGGSKGEGVKNKPMD